MMTNLSRDDLIGILSAIIPPRIPVEVDLWSSAEVAQFLKCSQSQVLERYAPLPDFPKTIRLPSVTAKKGHPRWKAKDIIEWAGKYAESANRNA
jgi:hypothetical protein